MHSSNQSTHSLKILLYHEIHQTVSIQNSKVYLFQAKNRATTESLFHHSNIADKTGKT